MTLAKLPPVDYKPWTPNPRTARSQVKRSLELQRPMPLPLQQPPAPRLPGVVGPMPQQQLPSPAQMSPMGGAPAMPAPGMAPPAGRLPGFAEGGDIDVGNYDDGLTDDQRQAIIAAQNLVGGGLGTLGHFLDAGQQAYQQQQQSLQAGLGAVQQGMGGLQEFLNAGQQAQQAQQQQAVQQVQNFAGSGGLGGFDLGNAATGALGSAAQAVGNTGPGQFIQQQAGNALDTLANTPLPIQGMSNYSNLSANAGPAPTLSDIGQTAMQAQQLPGQGLEQIPGFNQQPDVLQQIEKTAANFVPAVALGEASLPMKAAQVAGAATLGTGGEALDRALGTQNLLGPLGGGFQNLGYILGDQLPGMGASLAASETGRAVVGAGREALAGGETGAIRLPGGGEEQPASTALNMTREQALANPRYTHDALDQIAADRGVDLTGAKTRADKIDAIGYANQPEAQKQVADAKAAIAQAGTPEEAAQFLSQMAGRPLTPEEIGMVNQLHAATRPAAAGAPGVVPGAAPADKSDILFESGSGDPNANERMQIWNSSSTPEEAAQRLKDAGFSTTYERPDPELEYRIDRAQALDPKADVGRITDLYNQARSMGPLKTDAAQGLVDQVSAGQAAPAFASRDLLRTARDEGLTPAQYKSMTPDEIIDNFRLREAESTPAQQAVPDPNANPFTQLKQEMAAQGMLTWDTMTPEQQQSTMALQHSAQADMLAEDAAKGQAQTSATEDAVNNVARSYEPGGHQYTPGYDERKSGPEPRSYGRQEPAAPEPATTPPAPPPQLTPHQMLLSDASSMRPAELRQAAKALGVDVEGAINKDQLIGRVSQAARADDPVTDAHLQQISKSTGMSLGSLRTGDPQAILENRMLENQEMMNSRRQNPGMSNPALSQGMSRQTSAIQKAIDTHFPDSELSTQSVNKLIQDAYGARPNAGNGPGSSGAAGNQAFDAMQARNQQARAAGAAPQQAPSPIAQAAATMRAGNGKPLSATQLAAKTGAPSWEKMQQKSAAWLMQEGHNPESSIAAIEHWRLDQMATLPLQSPQGLAKLVEAVKAGITGELPDSYLTVLARHQAILESGLRLSDKSLSTKTIDKIVLQERQAQLALRYGSGPEFNKASKLLDVVARRGSSNGLERALLDVNQRFKNVMFPFDLGIFGQQLLSGMRNGLIPAVAGSANRGASALHLPFAREGIYDASLGRHMSFTLDGVKQFSTDASIGQSGTPLGWAGPPGKFLDSKLVSPVIDSLDKFQYGTILGTFRSLVHEGNLTMLSLAGQDIRNPLVRQTSARVANNIGSAAELALTPTRANIEKLTQLTPGMMRTQVNTLLDMSKVFRPDANEVERILGASMIASNAAVLLLMGKVINDYVGIRPYQMDPMGIGFGNITLPTRDSDGRHQVISIFPQATLAKALMTSANALASHDPSNLAETWARFVASRESAVLRPVTGAAGFGYDMGGTFHMGAQIPGTDYKTGAPMTPGQGLLAAAPIPQMAPTVAKIAQGQAGPVEGAAGVFGFNEHPESLKSEIFYQAKEIRGQANEKLADNQWRDQAFGPDWSKELQGRSYGELKPQEKEVVKEGLRQSGQGDLLTKLDALDKELDPNNAFTKAADAAKVQQDQTHDFKGKAYDVLNQGPSDLTHKQADGKLQPYQSVYSAAAKDRTTAEQAPYNTSEYTKAKADSDQKAKDAGKQPDALDKLLDTYHGLYSKFQGPDKKFSDQEFVDYSKAKLDLLKEAKDEGVGERYAHLITGARAQEPIDQRFAQARPVVDAYYNRNQSVTSAAAWRVSNPQADATLWYLGYVPDVRSQAALELGTRFTHDEGGSRVPTYNPYR